MKLKINPIVFILILFSVMSCATSKPSESIPPVITKTVSADCNSAIANFNSFASGNIIDQIATINKKHKGIPQDLKELYPKAREAWNNSATNCRVANRNNNDPSNRNDNNGFRVVLSRLKRRGGCPLLNRLLFLVLSTEANILLQQ